MDPAEARQMLLGKVTNTHTHTHIHIYTRLHTHTCWIRTLQSYNPRTTPPQVKLTNQEIRELKLHVEVLTTRLPRPHTTYSNALSHITSVGGKEGERGGARHFGWYMERVCVWTMILYSLSPARAFARPWVPPLTRPTTTLTGAYSPGLQRDIDDRKTDGAEDTKK